MDIYLSVNNRAEVVQLPVLPSSFTVSKPQSLQTFETVTDKDLQIIGTPKLKSISITSFFPVSNKSGYSYIRNSSIWGWDYVYKIDTWIEQKLPIRLIITDTPINMAVAVSNFEYSIKTDGDLWYTLELEEFNLLETETTETEEEELTVTQYEELQSSLAYLTGIVEELANPMIYNYIDSNMPSWAHTAVQAALDAGVLSGTGNGDLGLTYADLKTLTWMHRANLF